MNKKNEKYLKYGIVAVLIVLLVGFGTHIFSGAIGPTRTLPQAILVAAPSVYLSSVLACPATTGTFCLNTYVWDGSLVTSLGVDNYSSFTFCQPGASTVPIQCGGSSGITASSYYNLYLVNTTSGNQGAVSQANSWDLANENGAIAQLNIVNSSLQGGCSSLCQAVDPARQQNYLALISTFKAAINYNNNALFAANQSTINQMISALQSAGLTNVTVSTSIATISNPAVMFSAFNPSASPNKNILVFALPPGYIYNHWGSPNPLTQFTYENPQHQNETGTITWIAISNPSTVVGGPSSGSAPTINWKQLWLPAGVTTSTIGATTTITNGASITFTNPINPSNHSQNFAISVSGTGFHPNSAITFGYQPSTNFSKIMIDTTSTATGTWAGTFYAPWSTGTYQMYAQDASGTLVNQSMLVTAPVPGQTTTSTVTTTTTSIVGVSTSIAPTTTIAGNQNVTPQSTGSSVTTTIGGTSGQSGSGGTTQPTSYTTTDEILGAAFGIVIIYGAYRLVKKRRR